MLSHKKAQKKTDKRTLVSWLVSVVVVLLVFSLIVVAPVAAAGGHDELARGIYGAFAVFCHQRPERSYFIDGHQLAVCSRCTGIYGGFVLTLLLYPLIRSLKNPVTPPPSWLLLAALPVAIDFGVNFFGFWQNTHASRLLTGALLGGAVVFYVMPGIIDLSLRFGRKPAAKELLNPFTLASPEAIASAPSDYSAPERRI
jgi:uncharacterized membrane protein